MSFFRSSVSLCCTSGWLTIVTPSISLTSGLENRAVADDFHRRRGVGAVFARQPSARGPCAALEDFRQRHRCGIGAKPVPQTIRDAVEQRYRQRPPFHDQRRRYLMLALRIFWIAKREHAAID